MKKVLCVLRCVVDVGTARGYSVAKRQSDVCQKGWEPEGNKSRQVLPYVGKPNDVGELERAEHVRYCHACYAE